MILSRPSSETPNPKWQSSDEGITRLGESRQVIPHFGVIVTIKLPPSVQDGSKVRMCVQRAIAGGSTNIF